MHMHKRWVALLSMVGLALSTTLVDAQVLKGSKPEAKMNAKGAANEQQPSGSQNAPRQQKQATGKAAAGKAGKQSIKGSNQVK